MWRTACPGPTILVIRLRQAKRGPRPFRKFVETFGEGNLSQCGPQLLRQADQTLVVIDEDKGDPLGGGVPCPLCIDAVDAFEIELCGDPVRCVVSHPIREGGTPRLDRREQQHHRREHQSQAGQDAAVAEVAEQAAQATLLAAHMQHAVRSGFFLAEAKHVHNALSTSGAQDATGMMR